MSRDRMSSEPFTYTADIPYFYVPMLTLTNAPEMGFLSLTYAPEWG